MPALPGRRWSGPIRRDPSASTVIGGAGALNSTHRLSDGWRLARRIARLAVSRAGVTQLAECQLPKLNVAGSNPVSRSTSLP